MFFLLSSLYASHNQRDSRPFPSCQGKKNLLTSKLRFLLCPHRKTGCPKGLNVSFLFSSGRIYFCIARPRLQPAEFPLCHLDLGSSSRYMMLCQVIVQAVGNDAYS